MPLSNESPNQSQDEYVVAENEPNNHLYSLGKFMHTGLHGRRLMVQAATAAAPSSSTTLPPRRVTVATAPTGLANIHEGESGSGGEAQAVESSLEFQAISRDSVPRDSVINAPDDALPPRCHTVTAISRTKPKLVSKNERKIAN